MTYRYIMLEAGVSERFGKKEKSSLVVSDTGQTLLERAKRQFPRLRRITRSAVPDSLCACETFMASSGLWDEYVTILLGDVFYTDAFAAEIRSSQQPLVFFSDTQDIFAISFTKAIGKFILYPAAREVVEYGLANNRGRLWEMYRKVLQLPDDATVPTQDRQFIQVVNDETQDFDTPEEYEAWISGVTKNKLQKLQP